MELDFEDRQRKTLTGLVISIILFDLVCHIKSYFPPLYYHLMRRDHTEASNHFVSVRRFIIIGSTCLVIGLMIWQRVCEKDNRRRRRVILLQFCLLQIY